MKWLDRYHAARVHTRRVRVLAAAAARLLPPGLTVLDVGCGDGLLAATLGKLRPDLTLTGVELAPRSGCLIPVSAFDGRHLPFADRSFDAVLIVDVLHHTTEPAVLLHEAARVAKSAVLLKDHLREGWGAQTTLRLMDEVGNRRHAVALPYHYLSQAEWGRVFAECGLVAEETDSLRSLYPFPASLCLAAGCIFSAGCSRRPAARASTSAPPTRTCPRPRGGTRSGIRP